MVFCLVARSKCAKLYAKISNPAVRDMVIGSTVNLGLIGGAVGYGVDLTATRVFSEGEPVFGQQDQASVFDLLEQGEVAEFEVDDVRSFVMAISYIQLSMDKN